LGEGASKLARAVAVLGDGVPFPRACALAGLDEKTGHQLSVRLAQADVFAPARPLSFAHPILRAAVYAELDPGERMVAHRRAAELLAAEGAEVDAVAVHLLATEPRGDPQVVRTLRQAASWALSRGATQTAVRCMRRALEEPPEAGERPRLTFELASAELRTGDSASANDHFEAGVRATPDPRLRASFAWDHALALQALGRHEEAFRVRERAVDDVRGIDGDLAFSLEASLIASARFELSRLEWAKTRLDRYLAEPGLPERAEQRMRATRAQISAFDRSSAQPASRLAAIADRALVSGELIDASGSVTTPFFSAVELLSLADRPQRARNALDQLLEESQRRGSAPGFAFACGWRCLLLTREGLLSEAEADARSCAELALAQGWFRLGPPVLGYILEALIERDQLADAQRILQDSGVIEQDAADTVLLDPVIHARARLRALAGDLAASRSDLASLELRDARWNTYQSLVPPVLVAPELVGEWPEKAKADAEVMLREAHVWDTPRAIGMALRANALLCEGGTRIELLREAAAMLEASPARVEYARTLVDLGAALRASNHRAAARAPLRQALDIADAAGATLVARRANHELRAAGGRSRRPRTGGPEALTASERRIALMAAEGRSNPEIAQALFITKKTVEAHLASVYRKLEIHSRSQLEFALSDAPEAA
jgi:DNA-binding NarL/FixJ family response regulator